MRGEKRSCRVGERTVEAQAFVNGQSESARLERVGGGPANSLAEASKDLLEGEEVKEDEIKKLPGLVEFCSLGIKWLVRFQLPSQNTFTEIKEVDPKKLLHTLIEYREKGVTVILNINLPEQLQLQQKQHSTRLGNFTTPDCEERKRKTNQRIDIPISSGDRRSRIKKMKEDFPL